MPSIPIRAMASAKNFGIIEPLISGASFTAPEYTVLRYVRCEREAEQDWIF
jgi:hypothetical protein